MSFQPVLDTASVTTIVDRGGDFPVVSRYYFRNTIIPWNVANLTNLAESVRDWWQNTLAPLVSASYRLKTVKARDEEVEAGAQVQLDVDIPGTRAGALTPGIAAAVIQWHGDVGGVPTRGRTYHGGLVDGDTDADAITAATATDLQTAYADLPVQVNGDIAATAMVLVSRFSGTTNVATTVKVPTKRSPNAVVNTLDSVSVRTIIGSQTRRRRD